MENVKVQEKLSDTAVRLKYEIITNNLIANNMTIATMESMTSGLIASLLTDTAGASAVFRGAFVTYSNEVKLQQGVPEEVINKYGVYSEETACQMAKICKERFNTDIGIGVTGTAGNIDTNNADSIPGEVHFCIQYNNKSYSYKIVTGNLNTRYEYKLYAADKIADKIMSDILQNLLTK